MAHYHWLLLLCGFTVGFCQQCTSNDFSILYNGVTYFTVSSFSNAAVAAQFQATAAGGTSVFAGAVQVSGSALFEGALNTGTATATGAGNVGVGGTLSVTGTARFGGGLSVPAGQSVSIGTTVGSAAVSYVTIGSTTSLSPLTVYGATNLYGPTTVTNANGPSSTQDFMVVSGPRWLAINSFSTAGSWNPNVQAGDHSMIFSDGPLNTGNLVIGGHNGGAVRIGQDGSATFTGGVALRGATLGSNGLAVSGTALFNGAVTFGAGLSVTAGGMSVAGTATFNGALNANAAATFGGALSVTAAGSVTVAGTATFNGALLTTGTVSASGTATFNGQTIVTRPGSAGTTSGSTQDFVVSAGSRWLAFNSNQAGGAWNGYVQTGDHAIIFSDGTPNTGALVIGGWNGGGLRMTQDGTTTFNAGVRTPALLNGDGGTSATWSAVLQAGGNGIRLRWFGGRICFLVDVTSVGCVTPT